uniref:Glutathione peroxidase n=1 Tax=Eiseniibacteriota bacterium TaxID=2212470 RepID=A0A832I2N6_UNCEI
MDGGRKRLADYRGRTLLIVNTASRCGFTKQYASLETLYQRYRARGFEVLAFPANDFMNQEPGTDAEIQSFCSTEYGTTFPLFSKISVKGGAMAPLYRHLTRESAFKGDVEWNFTKFLVGPDGKVVACYGPRVDPLSKDVTDRIEALLGRS